MDQRHFTDMSIGAENVTITGGLHRSQSDVDRSPCLR